MAMMLIEGCGESFLGFLKNSITSVLFGKLLVCLCWQRLLFLFSWEPSLKSWPYISWHLKGNYYRGTPIHLDWKPEKCSQQSVGAGRCIREQSQLLPSQETPRGNHRDMPPFLSLVQGSRIFMNINLSGFCLFFELAVTQIIFESCPHGMVL